jgi:EmrB/QacA subfamily drug resistance transporter
MSMHVCCTGMRWSVSSSAAATANRRWLALIVLCVGVLMVVLDQTIVNVALPSIQSALGFSQSDLAWVVNAYLIAFGGLLLLAGRLGDMVGRKRIFIIGLAAFTVASLLCGVSWSPQMLIAARFIQGVGGALSSAVALGMIVTMFPQPRDQARAIGFYSFVASAGASIGLLAGGVLTQAISWHWIFFVNLPIGVAAALVAARLLESDRGIGLGEGADVVGAFLVTAALMLGVYTIVETSRYGWGSPQTVGFGVISLLLLGAFVVRQATAANPLLPLRIFRSRNVSGANLVQVLMVAGMLGFFFLNTLYLRQVLGFRPLEIGLAFMPVALAIGALSLGFSARLITRFGGRAMLLAGLTLMAAGMALVMRAPVHSNYPVDLLPVMILLGVGAGLSFPALMTLGMSGATSRDSGLASGLLNTTVQVGGAVGLAVMVTVAAARTGGLLASGQSAESALTGGYRLVYGIGVGLLAAAFVVAAAVLKPEPAAGDTVANEPAEEEDRSSAA